MENPHEDMILQSYRKSLLQLQSVWDEIGLEQSNRDIRVTHIGNEIKKLLTDMVGIETKFKKEIHQDIEKYGEQFFLLNKDLEGGLADPADNLSLLELRQFLRQNVDSLVKEVKKRTAHLKELQTKEQELCERLIEEPTEVPNKTVPSKVDFEDLERRIRTLEQEKVNREKKFRQLQTKLIGLVEDLEQRANCSLERDMLSEVELFTLSQQNLQKMKEITEKFELKVKQNEEESHTLRDQMTVLWNRLEIEQSEQDEFLSTAVGHTPSTLSKLHSELKRLKVKQQQDMAKFINKLRREIEDWWEKCYISEEERNDFAPYHLDEYSEVVLLEHEKEVERLSRYHKMSKNLFAKIEQRKQIWLRYIDLQDKANDTNRFGNRGGSLLKEEKERKRVKKELPMVEKELENLVLQWEEQQGKTFLIGGLPISKYIENEWLQYHDKKEQERKKKQTERINQLTYESRMGSRPPPAVKRRLAAINETNVQSRSKLQRVSEDQPLHLSNTILKNTSRRVALRERNQNSMREGSEHTSSEISTYSHFAEGIQQRSERENIRSSAVSGVSKTPMSIYRPSPQRPPPGLPKTPKTVPRPPSRFSPRLSGTRSARRSSRNMTSSRIAFSPSSLGKSKNVTQRLHFSPAASPLFKSPSAGSSSGTPSRWNKRTFLI